MKRLENAFEQALFASRWIILPFYAGLVVMLVAMLGVFVRDLAALVPSMFSLTQNEAILAALGFIDLTLAANLVLIVTFAGYENFVSKIDTAGHEDRPSWMGSVGFADIKLKLFVSIVAISGIQLLKSYMAVGGAKAPTDRDLMWLVAIHFAFVVTTLLAALTDWLSSNAKGSKA